jgi:hypothetical protein
MVIASLRERVSSAASSGALNGDRRTSYYQGRRAPEQINIWRMCFVPSASLAWTLDNRSPSVLIRKMRTRGDLLSFAIAFALMSARKLVRGLREG